MEKVILVCPSCRTRLSFAAVPGYQDKIVECPICHFKAKANVYQGGNIAKGGNGSDGPTQISQQLTGAMYNNDLGQIRVVNTKQCCPLKLGTNIIGRIAQSGKADIQITNDPYMSRRHLQIDVVKTDYGIEHDPTDGSPPGSPIPGILQARVLQWGAIAFSRNHNEIPLNPPEWIN